MQRAFAVVGGLCKPRGARIFERGLSPRLAQRGGYSALFRPSERLVQSRLAPIGRVAMNYPAFGRFVDCRNRRANLISGALWRGPNLFLQSAQVRLNASIVGGSSECLSRTFSG